MRRTASETIRNLERRIARLERRASSGAQSTRLASADKDMAKDLVLTLNQDSGYSGRVLEIAEKIKEDMDFKMFNKPKALSLCKNVLLNFVPKYERLVGVKVDSHTLDLAVEILCKENINYAREFGYSL